MRCHEFYIFAGVTYLNLSTNDYANSSHNNADAIRAAGVKCDDYTLSPHIFGYIEQSPLTTQAEIKQIYLKYDVVQIFHSCPIILNLVKDHPHIVVYHSGTRYREDPQKSNSLFNPLVKFSVTDQTEFMNLGAKNLSYLAPHTVLLPVPKRNDGKMIVGHYPSSPQVKGTREIREMIEPFKNDFEIRIDESQASHQQNLIRMGECHVYIELYKPFLNGKPYGCFGVTAFEAAALGCTVVTNDFHPMVYHEAYGACEFFIANDPIAFDALFTRFNKWHGAIRNRGASVDFYSNHNIVATGERILEITQ